MTEEVKNTLRELGIEVDDDDDKKDEKGEKESEAGVRSFSIHGPDGFKYIKITDGKTITIYNGYT